MKGQIEMLLANHYLTFPLFFTTVSPLLGTRLFWDSTKHGELLPHLRLRDLDGQTLCYRNTVDSCQEYSEFFSGLYSNKGPHINRSRYTAKMFHGMRNLGTYDPLSLLLFYQGSRTYFTMGNRQSRDAKRTFIGGQDILDPQYRQYPKNISSTDKQVYYDPILITDAHGAPSSWLQPYNL